MDRSTWDELTIYALLAVLAVAFAVVCVLESARIDPDGAFAAWTLGSVLVFASGFVLIARRVERKGVLLLIGIVALSLRLGSALFMYTAATEGTGFGSLFIKDDRFFFETGQELATEWRQGTPTFPKPTDTEPGPLYLSALIGFLFGGDPRSLAAVTASIGAWTCLVVAKLAGAFVPPAWARFAGFMVAVSPHLINLAATMQRDSIITLLFLLLVERVISIGRMGGRARLRDWVALLLVLLVLNAFRFYHAVTAAGLIAAWLVARSKRRTRFRIIVGTAVVAMAFIAVGSRFVSAERMNSMLVLQAIDEGRGPQLESAETFGFLGAATGLRRVLFLPVTFALALVSGFAPPTGLTNLDLLSAAVLLGWYPVVALLPFGTAAIIAARRPGSRFLLMAAVAMLFLAAIGYHGLIPRYRAAAEPLLIIIAACGAIRLGDVAAPYMLAIYGALSALLLTVFGTMPAALWLGVWVGTTLFVFAPMATWWILVGRAELFPSLPCLWTPR